MSFVRLKQPAITNVLPHAQNRRFAVNKKRLQNLFQTPVLFTGDSIMFGEGGYQAGLWETPADYVPSLPRLQQINVSYPGQGLQVIADNLQTNIDNNPGITAVIFNGGVNDVSNGPATSLADMQAAFTQILNIISTNDLAGMYVDMTPFGGSTGWSQASQDQMMAFRNWAQQQIIIRDEGSGLSNFQFCPLYYDFAEPDGITLKAEYGADNTHYNQRGATEAGNLISNFSFSAEAGGPPAIPPGTKFGYKFDTNQYFRCNTFTVDPTVDRYVYEGEWLLEVPGVTADLWGADNTINMRMRFDSGTNTLTGAYGDAPRYSTALTPPFNVRTVLRHDFSVPAQVTTTIDGGAPDVKAVSQTTSENAIVTMGDRSGGVGVAGILYKWSIFQSDGVTPIHVFNFDEGQGLETVSDQGEVATLVGTPGQWVQE